MKSTATVCSLQLLTLLIKKKSLSPNTMAMDTTLNEGVWVGYFSCFYHKNEETIWFPHYSAFEH
jgi:hypothetical protein